MALSRWDKRFGGNVIADQPSVGLVDADDMKQNVVARMAMSAVVAEKLGGQGVYSGGAYSISDFGGTSSSVVGPGSPTTTALNTSGNFNTTNLITSMVAADDKFYAAHEDDVKRWTTGTTWVTVGSAIFSGQTVNALANHEEVLYAAEARNDSTDPSVKVYDGLTTWTSLGSLTFAHSTKSIYSLVSHENYLYAAAGEKVFKYSGSGTTWSSIGDFSSLDSGVCQKLVSYRGNLYVGVVTDDSVNNKVRIYRYAGGTSWIKIGEWENVVNPGTLPNDGMALHDFIASDETLYVSLLFYDGASAADTTYTGVYKYLGNSVWSMLGTSIEAEKIQYYNGVIHSFGETKHYKYAAATNTWSTVATYASSQFPASALFDNKLQFVEYDSTNKNVVYDYAEQLTLYSGGDKYPTVTMAIYDDDTRAWFFVTDDEINITFWDTDTANGELWAAVKRIGSSTAAIGGASDIEFIAKDGNNDTPINHSILLGNGKITNSGFNTFYPSSGSFIDNSGNSSINFSLAGDKDESQIIVWNNQTVNIKGGLGVTSTIAGSTVTLDIDLAEYPGLEVVANQLQLKLDSTLDISANNELILADTSDLAQFGLAADTGSETLTLGNTLNILGDKGLSTISQDTNQLLINLDNPMTTEHTWTGKQYFKGNVAFNQRLRLKDLTNQHTASLQAEELSADRSILIPSVNTSIVFSNLPDLMTIPLSKNIFSNDGAMISKGIVYQWGQKAPNGQYKALPEDTPGLFYYYDHYSFTHPYYNNGISPLEVRDYDNNVLSGFSKIAFNTSWDVAQMTIALKPNGDLWSWGQTFYGESGQKRNEYQGGTSSAYTNQTPKRLIATDGEDNFIDISSTHIGFIALSSSGSIYGAGFGLGSPLERIPNSSSKTWVAIGSSGDTNPDPYNGNKFSLYFMVDSDGNVYYLDTASYASSPIAYSTISLDIGENITRIEESIFSRDLLPSSGFHIAPFILTDAGRLFYFYPTREYKLFRDNILDFTCQKFSTSTISSASHFKTWIVNNDGTVVKWTGAYYNYPYLTEETVPGIDNVRYVYENQGAITFIKNNGELWGYSDDGTIHPVHFNHAYSSPTYLGINVLTYSDSYFIDNPSRYVRTETFVPTFNIAWGSPVAELQWTTGSQSLSSDDYVWNTIEWDSATTLDDNLIWQDAVGQKHLITVGEHAEGWYLLQANIGIESNATGIREIKFDGYNSFLNNNILSGVDYMSETFTAVNGAVTVTTCQALMYLSPGDNLYVKILQDSGSALDVSTSTENNSLKIYRIF